MQVSPRRIACMQMSPISFNLLLSVNSGFRHIYLGRVAMNEMFNGSVTTNRAMDINTEQSTIENHLIRIKRAQESLQVLQA